MNFLNLQRKRIRWTHIFKKIFVQQNRILRDQVQGWQTQLKKSSVAPLNLLQGSFAYSIIPLIVSTQ